MKRVTKLIFGLGGVLLMAIAAGLMLYAPYTLVMSIMEGAEAFEREVFRSVGFLIVAIAVFDVAKYIFEEEAINDDERRNAAETRRSLTKFISTIIIALLLEGLVMTFEVAREEPSHLVYPTGMILAGVLLLVGLGVFQRLSASTEERVHERDPEASGPKPKRQPARSSSSR